MHASLSLSPSTDITQAIYGPILTYKDIDEWVWPPSQLLHGYAWWCKTYDPLVAHNPLWYVPTCPSLSRENETTPSVPVCSTGCA